MKGRGGRRERSVEGEGERWEERGERSGGGKEKERMSRWVWEREKWRWEKRGEEGGDGRGEGG